MIGCAILSIGGALQASASTIPHLIVGRIVAGLGNGINTSTIRKKRHVQLDCYMLTSDFSCLALRTHASP